ncbi:amidohydrolase family protein [Kribbella sp. NPDC004875]|uniref:amidohydrolase family protein n=1 Tax=Kribbella sp. NPDC004875 TaxID=3364107 RepID=UPI00369E7CBE
MAEPQPADLLIRNAIVLTMDPDFRVLAPGAVAVRADRIVAVGPDAELGTAYRATREIDAEGQIALPGLIDSHGHGGHTLIRGWYEGATADRWLEIFNDFYRTHTTEGFWYADGLLAAAERALAGVTTGLSYPGSTPCLDELTAVRAGARAYREVGLRHVAAVGPGPGPWPHVYGGTTKLSLADELELTSVAMAELPTDDLMCSVLPSPSNLTMDPAGAASDEPHPDTPVVWEHVAGLSRKHDVPIHAHAFRGMVTQAVRFVPEIVGPRLHLAHCTSQTRKDLDLIAEHRCSVAHGPYTHANVKAPCHVLELLEGGANVVIATDGAAPDRSFDLLAQVHPAIQWQRIQANDVQVLPAAKALSMVTIDAARALGLSDDLGSLEPGKKADIILVDGRAPHFQPLLPELAAHRLAYAANGNDVSTVIVDGRIIVRNQQLQTADITELGSRATTESRAALERSNLLDALTTPPAAWTATRY